MRRFLALLHKEWRDARAVTWASAGIALVACVALNELFFHYREAEVFARYVIPGLVALYMSVVASDLVAADVTSGRADTLALLPSPGRTAWTAKVTFLLLAGLLLVAWCHAAALLVHALAGRADIAGAIAYAFPDALPYHATAFGLAGTVLFFSALIQRSFAAALSGLLTMGAVVAALLAVPWRAIGTDFVREEVLLCASPLGLLLAAGAGWCYCRGPIHTAGLWRRTSIALALPLAVLIPAGAAGAIAVDDWITLEPGDPRAVISGMSASPDGRWIALSVSRPGPRQMHVWLASADGETVRPVPWTNAHLEGWSDDGRLMAWTGDTDGAWDAIRPWRRSSGLLRWIDPHDLGVVRTRSVEQVQAEAQARGNYPLGAPAWATSFHCTSLWDRDARAPSYRAQVFVGERRFDEDSCSLMLFSPTEPRVIFTPQPRHLVVRDILTGEDVVLGSGEGARGATFSSDGRFIAVSDRAAKRSRVVDARDGRTVAGPWPDRSPTFVLGGGEAGWVRLWGDRDVRLLDLDSGATLDVPWKHKDVPWVAALHDGRVAVARSKSLDIIATDGTRRRVLGPDE